MGNGAESVLSREEGGMKSLRKAINDKCIDCIHDPEMPGGPTEQIHLCTSLDCPLWPVRKRLKFGPKSQDTPVRLVQRLEQSHVDPKVIPIIVFGEKVGDQ